jgi:Ser/Thr protein kinase RdoA (MazF antagonist)
MNDQITVNAVLALFGLTEPLEIKPYGRGLINDTWLVTQPGSRYILQRVNQRVFRNPPDISYNIQLAGKFLKKKHPDYLFVEPLKTVSGDLMASTPHGWFRLFPFVEGSHSIDVAATPEQAFEAARQFGRFTAYLSNFRALKLMITLPDFHNLGLRCDQFEKALKTTSENHLSAAADCIGALKAHSDIAATYHSICENPRILKRATHHDTKISNVLFDEQGRGLCVVDLDTLMPGYFISDFGDMMRTYLCPVSEEEKDLSLIEVRDDFYKAILNGYMSEMREILSEEEQQHVYYSGLFMTYMQALRFLTDYLNGDVYYGASYPGHNLVRAKNQVRLLECLLEKEHSLSKMH